VRGEVRNEVKSDVRSEEVRCDARRYVLTEVNPKPTYQDPSLLPTPSMVLRALEVLAGNGLNPKTLNPKTLNPKTLNPKP
jgi:hypothetical protein